jgi:hypothetical protein
MIPINVVNLACISQVIPIARKLLPLIEACLYVFRDTASSTFFPCNNTPKPPRPIGSIS